MPKTAGVSSTPAEDSDTAQFVSIALFSGVGLLVSLIVVILPHERHFLTRCRDHAQAAAVGRGDGSRSRLNSGGVQIACGFQRAGHGFFAMLGTDLDAVGGNEFRILDADEAEHPAQIGFQVLADRGRRARAIKAAARDRDDDALVAGQTFDALRRSI